LGIYPKELSEAILEKQGSMGSFAGTAEPDEVRTAVRFPMQLALKVKTATGHIDAVTENISASGILFGGVSVPPVNSRIEFTIMMPAEVMGTKDDVLIECTGRVVRHQQGKDGPQAGAIIDDYSLRV
jgi:hypothetical protein